MCLVVWSTEERFTSDNFRKKLLSRGVVGSSLHFDDALLLRQRSGQTLGPALQPGGDAGAAVLRARARVRVTPVGSDRGLPHPHHLPAFHGLGLPGWQPAMRVVATVPDEGGGQRHGRRRDDRDALHGPVVRVPPVPGALQAGLQVPHRHSNHFHNFLQFRLQQQRSESPRRRPV
ncbi:hypothetical protein MTO96_002937 [Rhipicephalus appendiculatus]